MAEPQIVGHDELAQLGQAPPHAHRQGLEHPPGGVPDHIVRGGEEGAPGDDELDPVPAELYLITI